jgi:mono/diheme cytochrome c family protein
MLRYFFVFFIAFACGFVGAFGVRGTHFSSPPLQVTPDMKHQPKLIAQHGSKVFDDGRGDRELIRGTIPSGYQSAGRYYQLGASNSAAGGAFASGPDYVNTGAIGSVYGDGIPFSPSRDFLLRGQERFNIFCSVCHGYGGKGDGVARGLGLSTVVSLLDDRVASQPDGQLYSTITAGKNTMGAYGPVIGVEDRWAIVSYLRVLQRRSSISMDALPEELKKQLSK